ncbi:hypothetical protein JX265_003333 [Neoarthrinium moseri]|uniref:Uncharacterized protein n=1 Tax=Neoarthrinium moseri TaxID=1658444 RepID=A0A9Q0AS45_9PEZI|nr:uncharacterized protein JN550_000832 [Neoarthrinium moseri]KAI1876760.1 hypothetical protein JN550_000832 [Neoarthrinium moseri]KAI1877325.1 hypothetical protein JX265_003333 [Neoarthrinium moseri]
MQFSVAVLALFGTLAVANPFYPNLSLRSCSCEETPCCEVEGCCYPCREGSDADCAPEVTERSLVDVVV